MRCVDMKEVNTMTRKELCVECCYCELRVDSKMGTRDYCTLKKRLLSLDVCSRPACDRFELPAIVGGWDP
jgi:hypothetical protein